MSNMGRVTTSALGSFSSGLDGEPRAALCFAQSADANTYHNSGSSFNKTLLASTALLNPGCWLVFLKLFGKLIVEPHKKKKESKKGVGQLFMPRLNWVKS